MTKTASYQRPSALSHPRDRRLEPAPVQLSRRRLQGARAHAPHGGPPAHCMGDRHRGPRKRVWPRAHPGLQWVCLVVDGAVRVAMQLRRAEERRGTRSDVGPRYVCAARSRGRVGDHWPRQLVRTPSTTPASIPTRVSSIVAARARRSASDYASRNHATRCASSVGCSRLRSWPVARMTSSRASGSLLARRCIARTPTS